MGRTQYAATLPKAGEQRTMSSIEIAELTGKDHFNVLNDIRKMLMELHGVGGDLKFQASYRSAQNKSLPCYELPYDETMVLVTGYSIPLRAAVVRRWRELEEAKPALPNFADPVAAARAWADEVELKRTAHPGHSDREAGAKLTVIVSEPLVQLCAAPPTP